MALSHAVKQVDGTVSSTVSTPLSLLLNPTLIALVPRHIPMTFAEDVGFSCAKTHELSSVYTDMYDDDMLLHGFCFIILSDCTDCIR